MNNTQSIIQNLELPRDERQIFEQMARLFDQHTPDFLYLNPYELAEATSVKADYWDRFLDIPEVFRYRHAKIAKLTEYAAIKAMKGLEAAGQSPGAGAVTALKEIASLSKQLNSGQNNRQKIILTYVKPKERTNE